MIRSAYRGLLWLHPAEFGERFGEEMLWIFDQRQPGEIGFALLLDCIVSFYRQWLNYPPVRSFAMGLSVSLVLALLSVVCASNTAPRP